MAAAAPQTLYERLINGHLNGLEREDLGPFLPLVMRLAAERTHDMAHCRLLTGYKDAARVASYLGLDYAALQSAVEEELRMKAKLPDSRTASYVGTLGEEAASQFEAADNDLPKRIRIVVSEIFNLIDATRQSGRAYESEIIANPLYHRELSYIIPIALMNMPVLKLNDVVHALLSLDTQAASLIHAIVRNMPSTLYRVLALLAESAASGSEAWGEKIKTVLLRICELTPSVAPTVRSLLVDEHRTLPNVALLITMKYTNDEVVFLNSLQSPSYAWMRDYLRKLPEDAFPFGAVRDKLLFHLQQVLKASSPKPLELARLFRVYCGLCGLAGIKLNQQEMEALLSVIAQQVPDRRVLELATCFILGCEGLLKTCGRKAIATALSALLESRRVTELVLLCAIRMHTQEYHAAIQELVRSTLGLKVSIAAESLAALQPVFTEDLLPEAALAREAPMLGIVPQLSARSASLVPQCVLALLKGRLLARQKVDLSGWVSQQLKQAAEPLHPLMPAILQEYAAACFTETWAMQPLAESELQQLFASKDNNMVAAQVLALYWVLAHDEAAQAAREDRTRRGSKGPMPRSYSRELTDAIPAKKLLRHAEKNAAAYAVLLPVLSAMLVAQFPQLFALGPLLAAEEMSAAAAPPPLLLDTHAASGEETPTEGPLASLSLLLSSPLDNARAPQLAIALHALTTLDTDVVVANYLDSVLESLLPAILSPDASYEVVQLFRTLWMQFYAVHPWTLAIRTLNLLRPPAPSTTYVVPLRHSDVVTDPLLVLRCDPRVYSSPPLYSILLVILTAFLAASRKQIYARASQAAQGKASEEHTTLVLAQDAAVVQMLLEVCGTHEATRAQTCSYLHDMFIECPLLIKLVHFQTYNLNLLPLAAAGIASMHVCFDFLLELLAQPQPAKQVFAVHLAAELSLRYPIQKALPICRSVLSFLATLRFAPDGERALIPSLPCLEKFCIAFPMLAPDATDLLLELAPQAMVGTRLHSLSPLEAAVQETFAKIAQSLTRT